LFREMRILSNQELIHPSLVRYHFCWLGSEDVAGCECGFLYIVTEHWREGMREYCLRATAEMKYFNTALALFNQIVEAVVLLHDKGVLHRNICMQSCFVADEDEMLGDGVKEDRTAKLGEFGLSRYLPKRNIKQRYRYLSMEDDDDDDDESENLTPLNSFAASPEQRTSDAYDKPSDERK